MKINTEDEPLDWYDLWRYISHTGAFVSIAALMIPTKKEKNVAQWGALLSSTSSIVHFLMTPPRCGKCHKRMVHQGINSIGYSKCTTCNTVKSDFETVLDRMKRLNSILKISGEIFN